MDPEHPDYDPNVEPDRIKHEHMQQALAVIRREIPRADLDAFDRDIKRGVEEKTAIKRFDRFRNLIQYVNADDWSLLINDRTNEALFGDLSLA